jgi:hypothetical protein
VNYYQARQVKPEADRPDAGKWRFTRMNDHRIWPEGACAEDCPGHDTPEEADRHFYDGERAEHIRRGTLTGQQRNCQRCEAWTQQVIDIGNQLFQSLVLCEDCAPPDDDDKTRASAVEVDPFRPGISITSSW